MINLCARRLERSFECRDIQFLRLYLQYCLLQSHYGFTPEFNPVQQAWTQMRAEYAAAHEIVRHWRRRVTALPPGNEHAFLSLLFMMLRTPDPLNDSQQQDKRLQQAITHMIARFRALAGLRFSDEQGLAAQLYVHPPVRWIVISLELVLMTACRRRFSVFIHGWYAPRARRYWWWKKNTACVLAMRKRARGGHLRGMADAGKRSA